MQQDCYTVYLFARNHGIFRIFGVSANMLANNISALKANFVKWGLKFKI